MDMIATTFDMAMFLSSATADWRRLRRDLSPPGVGRTAPALRRKKEQKRSHARRSSSDSRTSDEIIRVEHPAREQAVDKAAGEDAESRQELSRSKGPPGEICVVSHCRFVHVTRALVSCNVMLGSHPTASVSDA
jgi:hypothetical protein